MPVSSNVRHQPIPAIFRSSRFPLEFLDELAVYVEAQPGGGDSAEAAQQLGHHIKSTIGVSAAVHLVAPGGVERSLGKARRIVDKRPK